MFNIVRSVIIYCMHVWCGVYMCLFSLCIVKTHDFGVIQKVISSLYHSFYFSVSREKFPTLTVQKIKNVKELLNVRSNLLTKN